MAQSVTATLPIYNRFPSLANTNFRAYLATNFISIVGDNMDHIIRNWLVWELTRSPLMLGMMIFYHWIPFTALALHAGMWADRFDRRKILVLAQFVSLASALLMGATVLAGRTEMWIIAALMLLHGLSGAFSQPSVSTIIHDMVGDESLASAISLNSMLRPVANVFGPALGGFMIALVGVGPAFFLNAITFVPLIVALSLMRLPPQVRGVGRGASLKQLLEGIGFVRADRNLLALVGIATVPVLLVGPALQYVLPVFATDVFSIGPEGLGLLMAGSGLGALLAAWFVTGRQSTRKGTILAVAAVGEGVLTLAFAGSSWFWVSLALLVGIGACQVASQALTNTLLQLAAPAHLRGRVMGVYGIGTMGLRMLSLWLGAAAAAIGAPLAVAIGAAGIALLVTAILVRTPTVLSLK